VTRWSFLTRRPSSNVGWKPAVLTRFAFTWPRSVTPWSATRCTAGRESHTARS
jgi:hypothetical protein